MEAKEEIIKKLTRILRREHVNYEETKYIFKAVRDKLELKPQNHRNLRQDKLR